MGQQGASRGRDPAAARRDGQAETAAERDSDIDIDSDIDESSVPDPVAALRRQAISAAGYVVRPRSYVGVAREAALAAVHMSTYPLGLMPGLRPANSASAADADEAAHGGPLDEETAATPVILVHGYVHNRSAFLVMSRALRRAGFRHVRGINYNPLAQDMASIAGSLADEVEDTLGSTGASQCMIVGHSMGGIIARHYVQLLGGDEHVDTVVTLGAPHRGSYTSYVGLGPAALQLRPGSTYLRHLEETARPGQARWIAYYSDLDFMVLPAVHAKLVHPALAAENIRVRDTGHLSLLMSGEVLRSVITRLSAGRTSVATGAGAQAGAT